MFSVPLPFVASLLFLLTGFLLYKRKGRFQFGVVKFVLFCALGTFIVGLRWTFDLAILRYTQSVFSATLPIITWLCFTLNGEGAWQRLRHFISPLLIAGLACYPDLWLGAVDVSIALLFFVYGIGLFASARYVPNEARLSDFEQIVIAKKVAGMMLIFSAFVDGLLSVDYLANDFIYAETIVSISYFVMIPAIVWALIIVSSSIPINDSSQSTYSEEENAALSKVHLSEDEAREVVGRLDSMMKREALFKDPDLTLSRLGRKLGCPAKRISMAVNQVYGRNISKVLNEYRIRYAMNALCETEKSITDIFMQAGFQSKSNFNREFLRVAGITPTQYRLKHKQAEPIQQQGVA